MTTDLVHRVHQAKTNVLALQRMLKSADPASGVSLRIQRGPFRDGDDEASDSDSWYVEVSDMECVRELLEVLIKSEKIQHDLTLVMAAAEARDLSNLLVANKPFGKAP